MNKYLFLLLCTCVVWSAFAGEPVINRSHLRETLSGEGIVGKLPVSGDLKEAQNHRQPLSAQGFNPSLNKFNNKTPQRMSDSDLLGTRIIVADVYDFDWDNETGIATVIDTSYFMMGKMTALSHYSGINPQDNNNFLINGFYEAFDIPVFMNTVNNVANIQTGVLLAQKTYRVDTDFPIVDRGGVQNSQQDFDDLASSNVQVTTWSLYVMPESWLAGDDDYNDIRGDLHEDGSVTFRHGFAFLIHESVTFNGIVIKTSWGLSPVFRNVSLLVSNGVHEYDRISSLPNNPVEVNPYDPWQGGDGHGGVVSRPINPRPINPKPVTPRPINNNLSLSVHVQDIDRDGGEDLIKSDEYATHYTQPVYMFQLDDTTLLVYNMFGNNYCWNYMRFKDDGSVTFPSQVIAPNSAQNGVVINCSIEGDSVKWDNECSWLADTIAWDATYNYNYTTNQLLSRYYNNNKLYFSDGERYLITFDDPVVTDYSVEFGTSSYPPYLNVMIQVSIPDTGEQFEVNNNWSAPRTDSPYLVCLEAYAEVEENDSSYTIAGPYLEYMVPALAAGRGDVNCDGAIDVSDITSLINVLLDSGINADGNLLHEAMDCNVDGAIDVSDVTALIAYVLGGGWHADE